ncbi:MAG: ribonucleoside-diphosphate reductase, adenosylcobalamin-dependent, partial [Thermoproteus sp.]
MAVKVVKASGAQEVFSEDKLHNSLVRAASDVGVSVDGEVKIIPTSDISSAELSDLVELELLRRAIERPELVEVAKSHLLGRIYKEAFGKDYLKSKTGYRERALASLKRLADSGLLRPEALDLIGRLDLRPDFDKSLGYNALRLFTNGNYALRGADFRIAETPAMAAARVATA